MAKYFMVALVDKETGEPDFHEAQGSGVDITVRTSLGSAKDICVNEQRWFEKNCPESSIDFEMRVIELGPQHVHVYPKEATKVWETKNV